MLNKAPKNADETISNKVISPQNEKIPTPPNRQAPQPNESLSSDEIAKRLNDEYFKDNATNFTFEPTGTYKIPLSKNTKELSKIKTDELKFKEFNNPDAKHKEQGITDSAELNRLIQKALGRPTTFIDGTSKNTRLISSNIKGNDYIVVANKDSGNVVSGFKTSKPKYLKSKRELSKKGNLVVSGSPDPHSLYQGATALSKDTYSAVLQPKMNSSNANIIANQNLKSQTTNADDFIKRYMQGNHEAMPEYPHDAKLPVKTKNGELTLNETIDTKNFKVFTDNYEDVKSVKVEPLKLGDDVIYLRGKKAYSKEGFRLYEFENKKDFIQSLKANLTQNPNFVKEAMIVRKKYVNENIEHFNDMYKQNTWNKIASPFLNKAKTKDILKNLQEQGREVKDL